MPSHTCLRLNVFEIIALNEAIKGFICLCERSNYYSQNQQRTLAALNQFQEVLENVQLQPMR